MDNPRAQYLVLMIEDTPDLATLNLLILRKAGFTVHHAADGESALLWLEENRPDVVLLDLNLPRVSGWDVLKFAYSKYGEENLPVIVTTAYSDSANRVVGKLQQVERYLTKPVSTPELLSALDKALGITV